MTKPYPDPVHTKVADTHYVDDVLPDGQPDPDAPTEKELKDAMNAGKIQPTPSREQGA